MIPTIIQAEKHIILYNIIFNSIHLNIWFRNSETTVNKKIFLGREKQSKTNTSTRLSTIQF